MNKQIIRFFAVLSLCYATNTLSAATPVLPTGTWLFTTQIQLQLIPKTGSATLSLPTVIKGHDIGTFFSDHSYSSTEWLTKQQLYFTDSPQNYLVPIEAQGQWTATNSSFTLSYDPFTLSATTRSGKNGITGFLTRLDFVNLLAASQNNRPVFDSVKMQSYINNGQVLNKGKKLSGQKVIFLSAEWHDDYSSRQQAVLIVTEKYTAIPYSLTSPCCGDDGGINAIDSRAFMNTVDSLPDIQKTARGLRFLVLQEGKGAPPVKTDTVLVNYHGSYPSGKQFDSNTLMSFNLSGVIQGFAEGLQLMNPGSKYRLFIPSDLGYGVNGSSIIKPSAALIFDVELIAITSP
jgi:FKBP-type peptidyl-prolyl cis-trans isomerase